MLKTQKIAYLLTVWMMRPQYFHEWRILGRVAVVDANVRKSLLVALNEGIRANDEMDYYGRRRFALARVGGAVIYKMQTDEELENNKLITSGGCFQPRHGIRIVQE